LNTNVPIPEGVFLMKIEVPFFDLKPQFKAIEQEIRSAMDEVFKTQQFIMGPQIERLEQTIAGYCSMRYAIGVASGRMLFLSSGLGISPGDKCCFLLYFLP
jgi:dTDP-4-amino-4,6-dideoxygalactose transaminase